MKRAKAVKALQRFIANANNTITDQKTGLLIIQDPTLLGDAFKKVLTYAEALTAIAELNKQGYAGYNDWRLPTVEEFCAMTDRTKYNPSYDTSVFKGNFNDWYWSGETCAWNKNAAWCVSSTTGSVDDTSKDNHNYVRPVRSSQCQFDHLPER